MKEIPTDFIISKMIQLKTEDAELGGKSSMDAYR